MLPSRGYFKSMNCPFFDSGFCDRPHCHFRHIRKDKPLDSTILDEEESSNNSLFDSSSLYEEQPIHSSQKPDSGVSYTPTPIAELKKRHIPVTTAPSVLVDPSQRRKAESNIHSSKRFKAEYVPTVVASTQASRVEGTDSINNINEPHDYKATKISLNSNLKHSTVEACEKYLSLNSNLNEDSEEEIDFNLVTDELNFIDEILMEYSGNKSEDEIPDNTDQTNQNEFNKDAKQNDATNHDTVQDLKNTSDKENFSKNKERKTSKGPTVVKEPKDTSDNNFTVNTDINKEKKKKHKSKSRSPEKKMSSTKHRRNADESVTESKNEVIDSSKQKTDIAEKTHVPNISLHSNKHKHRDSSSSSKMHKTDKSKKEQEISLENSSKKSDHKSSSLKTTKLSNNVKSSSVQKERKCQDSQKNKNESKSKQKSSSHDSVRKDRCSSKHRDKPKSEHDKNRDRRKSKSSSENAEKRKSTEPIKTEEPQRLSPKKTRVEDEESDNDIEIISDSSSVIVIDSEDETSEVKMAETEQEDSPSPAILPDDSDFSDDSGKHSNDSICASAIVPVVHDSSSQLDHRVKAKTKARVSLGYAWRPEPPKKKPELVLPADRFKAFLRLREQENNEGTSTGRMKIGCVPNVHGLLEEKRRILDTPKTMAEKSGEKRKSLPMSSSTKTICLDENEDCPPEVTDVPHPLKAGAEKGVRQSYMDALYKITRQLTKPGVSYKWAQNKCLTAEKEVFVNSNQNTYEDKIKALISVAKSKIPGFTQRYFDQIKSSRASMFPPDLRRKPDKENPSDGNSNSQNVLIDVSLYSALKKYALTDDQLETEGYPRWKKDTDLVRINEDALKRYNKISPAPTPRGELTCSKCGMFYCVDEKGLSTDPKGCNYHSKRGRDRTVRGVKTNIRYCCNQDVADTCMYSPYHSTELKDLQNLEGFKATKDPIGEDPEEGWGIFALDCEMLWTTNGLELGRVSVVNTDERCVYDAFVRPERPVTDYSTKYSGLTEANVLNSPTSFEDVQNSLLQLFNSKTILIGHSLENDLRVLKIVHNTVVDTAITYGAGGRKLALKTLAKDVLKLKIQEGEAFGHDSYEDAETCLKLMVRKALKDSMGETKKKAPVMRAPFKTKESALFK